MSEPDAEGPLRARHEIQFSYRRSLDPAQRTFLAGLSRGELWGSVDASGKVTVPPVDWDPATGAPAEGFVRLSGTGRVRSWTWVGSPRPGQALETPHALALIDLDGAATALLHMVDVRGEASMRSGMAVRADWRIERVGSVRDIRAFVALHDDEGAAQDGAAELADRHAGEAGVDVEAVEVLSEVKRAYNYQPGLALSGFLRSLSKRRVQGGRCPACGGVYVPPHSTCPACRRGPMIPVEMAGRGVITSYTVVHTPFQGMAIDLPFVCAWIRLDGASVPFAHLLGEVPPDEVEVGARVEAVWALDEPLLPTWESIRYFRPLPRTEPR
jgi:uncharacterized OB-fold protein